MADIETTALTGSSVHAIIRNSVAQPWNGTAFEVWNDAHYASYLVTLTEQGTSGFFAGSIPVGINEPDTLTIEIYSGPGTLGSDTYLTGGTLEWSGSSVIVPFVGTALTSLAYVKDFCQITGTDFDTFLQNRINGVSAAIESYCRRTFALQTYTDNIDGPGSTTLLIPQFPVVSVTQVVTGFYDPNPTTIPGSNFIVNKKNGIVSMKPSSTYSPWFGYSDQGIQITYQAGYSPIPADIQEATASMVRNQYLNIGQDVTLLMEKIGDYQRTSRSDVQKLLTDDIKETLNNYKQGTV